MTEHQNNAFLLTGIIVGLFLLAVAWVAGRESSAPEVFADVCLLLGGTIGVGGSALPST
jgi:hypothetical protein